MAAEPILCPDNMLEPWLLGVGIPTQMTFPAGTFVIMHPDTWVSPALYAALSRKSLNARPLRSTGPRQAEPRSNAG